MNSQAPQSKADYLMQVFNEDINACLSLCDKMIEGNIVNCTSYYQQVKEILIKNKSENETLN